jgi:hypothetical protein
LADIIFLTLPIHHHTFQDLMAQGSAIDLRLVQQLLICINHPDRKDLGLRLKEE